MKLHRKFRQLIVMVTTFVLAISGILVAAPSASAYTLTGARLPSGSFNVRISAGQPGVSTGWVNAISSWNATPTLILISRPVAPTPPITLAEVNDYGVGWDGIAYWNAPGGITQTGTAYLNYRFTKLYNQATTDGVAAHEIGHLIGLGHVASGCFLMNGYTQSRCGVYKPTSDEVNGAKALYK